MVHRLHVQLTVLFTAFVLLVLVSVGATYWGLQTQQQDALVINLAGRLFQFPLPQQDKRLLAIAETDGCFVDGLSAATGCYVGRRSMRIEDYGKAAVTFMDTLTEQAIRIAPQSNVRELVGIFRLQQKINGRRSSSVIATSLMNYCFTGNG